MKVFVLAQSVSPNGPAYTIRHGSSSARWPTQQGRALGACGMWNFLWRLGFHPQDVTAGAMPPPAAGDVLFAQCDDRLDAGVIASLNRWVEAGGRLVCSGDPEPLRGAGDGDDGWSTIAVEHPYAALAYVNTPARTAPLLMTPSVWSFARVKTLRADLRRVGAVAAISGERQSPARALVTVLPDAPAAIVRDRACYLNANPFAAFQAWLQGQEDLQPWMAWRHRLLWLDEWVSDVARLLVDLGVLSLEGASRPGVPGLASTTIVLRHDVDDSRDLAYLEDEKTRRIAATYAVLLNRDTRFWVEALSHAPTHECAFHYATGKRDWLGSIRHAVGGCRRGEYQPDRRAVNGRGLVSQIRRAKTAGIGIATLHRHLSFLPYPEWIAGFDDAFRDEPGVIGGSTLFRAQVLRWGAERIDGRMSTVGEWPDAQFPLWLPFKIANAARGGARLRGWESTSLMEPEPSLIEQLLRHRIPFIEQRVFTLAFHPAHAHGRTFAAAGLRGAFNALLDLLTSAGVELRTLRDVYALADRAMGSDSEGRRES